MNGAKDDSDQKSHQNAGNKAQDEGEDRVDSHKCRSKRADAKALDKTRDAKNGTEEQIQGARNSRSPYVGITRIRL